MPTKEASPAPHAALVWLVDTGQLTDQALAPLAAWLDASERQRLDRFVRPARRHQFLAGRILARRALGDALGVPPRSVGLLERPGNGPLPVVPGYPGIGLSISHSGPWVACAVSATSRLGLDIELVDERRDIDALAAQAFGPQQQALLAARPAADRVRDFYRMWSLAEARFKLQASAACEIELPHPQLSIVLCSELPLASAQLRQVELPA